VGGCLRVHSLGIQHHHLIDDNLGAGFLLAVCSFVVSRLETPLNVNFSPLREILAGNFCQFPPGNDIVKFREFLAFSFVICPLAVGGNAKITDRLARLRIAKNGVSRKIA